MWRTFLLSNIIPDRREKVVFCAANGKFNCYGYDITINNFTNVGQVTSNGCKNEIIEMEMEYFPETKEFLVGCKGEGDTYFIGKYSSNFEFTTYNQVNISSNRL